MLSSLLHLTVSTAIFEGCESLSIGEEEGVITEHEIVSNVPVCIAGSFIIGANQSFEATIADINVKYPNGYKIGETKDNIVAALHYYERSSSYYDLDDKQNVQQYIHGIETRIKCKALPCKIQAVNVFPSDYARTYKKDETGLQIYSESGTRRFVSTLRSGSLNLPLKYSVKGLLSKTKSSYKYVIPQFIVIGMRNKTFTYKTDPKIFLRYAGFEALHGDTEEDKTGIIGSSTNLTGDVMPEIPADKDSFSVEGTFTLNWNDVENSTSANEPKLLIPEFTAQLSANGGLFTVDDVNQPFPSIGLGPGAIAGIVVACIVVVIIIAVCIWLFAFGGINKCKGR